MTNVLTKNIKFGTPSKFVSPPPVSPVLPVIIYIGVKLPVAKIAIKITRNKKQNPKQH
jgi:hypothetical protein